MKKFAALLMMMGLSSGSAFAIPAPSSELLNELLTNNAEFADILKMKLAVKTPFDSITAKRMAWTQKMRQRCNNMSKSGALLKVEITNTFKNTTEIHYFSTHGAVRGLTRCN